MDRPQGVTSIRLAHDMLPLRLRRSSAPWQEQSYHSQASRLPVGAYGVASVCPSVAAGWTPSVSRCLSPASLRKSHSTWMPCQNCSDWPKKAPKRIDMAGVIDRRPCTISLIARGATPMARAMAFCEIPIGLRYSSSKISPGVMGSFMSISYNVIGLFSMIIDYRNLFRPGIRPPDGLGGNLASVGIGTILRC